MPKQHLAANATSMPPTSRTFVPPLLGTADYFTLQAYNDWLFTERRILCGALGSGDFLLNTPARDFHCPMDGPDWRDLPAPATRARTVMRFVGLDMNAIDAWARAEAAECQLRREAGR